jgi:hypothetical protein
MLKKIWLSVIVFMVSLGLLVPVAAASPWTYEIDPYLWAINMNGRVGVGPATAHVNENFHDILKQLNFAAMVYAAAHKDKYGVYVNAIYAVTSDGANVGPISIDVKNKLGIFGAGVTYIAYEKRLNWYRKFTIEPYAGFRYTFNDTTVNINHFNFKDNRNWTDPLVGLQFKLDLSREWFANLSGDVGGTNRAKQFSYSALGLLGYHPNSWQHTSVYLGYRLLSQHYETGSGLNFYNWDIKLFGPLVGFRFTF